MNFTITTRILTVMLLLLSALSGVWAESLILADLRDNPDYVYGQGYGATYTEADRGALSDLISKIAVGLTTEIIDVTNVTNSNGTIDTDNAINLVVSSYSQATLTNAQSITVAEDPQYCIVRYISRSELDKIFNHRKEKVYDYVRNGQKAESRGKVDDALRYYYWALSLLKSLQYPNQIRYNNGGEDCLLMTWLPVQIERILGSIHAEVSRVEGNEATLRFTVGIKPVASLAFSFFNGNGWTPLNNVKDGLALIEIRPGVDPSKLRIRYEYEFLGEAQIDPEIQAVTRIFNAGYFKGSETVVGGDLKSKGKSEAKIKSAAFDTGISSLLVKDSKPYSAIMDKVVDAISRKDFSGISSYFTDEGWKMFSGLLHYGKAKIIEKKPVLEYYGLNGDRVVARSIKMSFDFPNNHLTFTEDVTFTFNADGKIESVAFGLGDSAKEDVFNKGGGMWDEKSKLLLASFLENYKTAFALERTDYIESIFDKNAIIIIGTVAKRLEQGHDKQDVRIRDIVSYNQLSKDEYIKRLKRVFATNEFVNINFANTDILKMPTGGETYGIQVHQDYYSSHYGDTGYLFLIVDLNNPEEPIITVRTWQPERDPNINNRIPRDHPDYGIYAPGMF